jgi:dihydropteroate synthase
MHMQGDPTTMQIGPRYDDVVAEVASFLRSRLQAAIGAGVAADQIMLDPGIGFGKSIAHNFAILRQLDDIVAIGQPVLVGASRKSFLGRFCRQDHPASRLGASLACVARAMSADVRIVRVHDVLETRQLVDTLKAISQSGPRP